MCLSLFSGGLHCITKATRVNKSTECFFLFIFQFIYWNLCSCCCCVCFCGSHYSLCHPILQTINAPLIAFCYRSGSSDWLAPLCPSQSSYRVFFFSIGFRETCGFDSTLNRIGCRRFLNGRLSPALVFLIPLL